MKTADLSNTLISALYAFGGTWPIGQKSGATRPGSEIWWTAPEGSVTARRLDPQQQVGNHQT
jgi:hypothetical protein